MNREKSLPPMAFSIVSVMRLNDVFHRVSNTLIMKNNNIECIYYSSLWLEKRVKVIVTRGTILHLVSFSFIIVFREGLEIVLFLAPTLATDTTGTIPVWSSGRWPRWY
ncbi:MAG TPA: hypothetical protein EYP46_03965 [Hadesarchaea archaeon]|nr:hypothetical protein [Hadesarchaea archaeon]